MKISALFFVSLIGVGLLVFSLGCHQSEKKIEVTSQPRKAESVGELLIKYPPEKSLDRLDGFRNAWYSKYLEAMNEPAFFSLEGHGESYRFIWLRSFDHPITIRIWQIGQEKIMVVKELDEVGGNLPAGKLILDQRRQLTEDEWGKFLSLVNEASFWRLQTRTDELGKDGASWILEGKKEGKTHLVDRFSPASGKYREACLYLLELSGLKVKDIY